MPSIDSPDFMRVWQAYPRKVAKGAARKAFERLAPDADLVARMLETLAWQRRTPQWLDNGGVFIPHLSTWINQERYDDEPFEVPQLSPQSVRLLRLVNE